MLLLFNKSLGTSYAMYYANHLEIPVFFPYFTDKANRLNILAYLCLYAGGYVKVHNIYYQNWKLCYICVEILGIQLFLVNVTIIL